MNSVSRTKSYNKCKSPTNDVHSYVLLEGESAPMHFIIYISLWGGYIKL